MARRSRRRKATEIDLDRVLSEVLKEYGEDVTAAIAPTTDEVAAATVARLKTLGDYDDITEKYRKSFTHETKKTYRGATSIIFSEDVENYRLTHLLEKGHLTRDGTSRVRAYPHWKDAEEFAVKEYEKKLRENIETI